MTNQDNNRMREDRERGFITILAILIMVALISVSIGYIGVTAREGDMTNRLKKADQARQASIACTRLAAGALIVDKIADGASPYDGFDENWFSLTNKTASGVAGNIDPYVLDATQGIYCSIIVIDLDGRVKTNPSAANAANSQSLANALPRYDATQINDLFANDYLTLMEYGRSSGVGNEMMSYVTPYGSDYRVNINTIDPLDNGAVEGTGSDLPDVFGAISQRLASLSSYSIAACGTSAPAGSVVSSGNSFAKALLRYRRGGAAASYAGNTATGPTGDFSKACGVASPPGGPYADAKDYPLCEWGPGPLRTTKSLGVSAAEYCRLSTNSCLTNQRKLYNVCQDFTKVSSEGFFLIQAKGWVLQDATASDKIYSTKAAEYQIMHIVKRTSSGYDDCYHREWWQERRDMYGAGYATGDYEYENTIYVYDKDVQ